MNKSQSAYIQKYATTCAQIYFIGSDKFGAIFDIYDVFKEDGCLHYEGENGQALLFYIIEIDMFVTLIEKNNDENKKRSLEIQSIMYNLFKIQNMHDLVSTNLKNEWKLLLCEKIGEHVVKIIHDNCVCYDKKSAITYYSEASNLCK